jgi:hypothetical protein
MAACKRGDCAEMGIYASGGDSHIRAIGPYFVMTTTKPPYCRKYPFICIVALAWYGHVMRRDESHITKRVMGTLVELGLGKDVMDCVKDDMKIKGGSMEMTSDRREWKKKTCCDDPT